MKKYEVTVNGQVYQIELKEISEVEIQQHATTAPTPKSTKKESVSTGDTPVPAPMAGTVLTIGVKIGDSVKKGDTLCVLEAMKMETAVVASKDSVVASIEVSENQSVESNQLLMVI